MDKQEVLCIGNAIVDIIAKVDDAFLDTHERVKGSMMLVDEETSARLYEAMPPAVERSGGSAGNTAAGIASFGGQARYIGKVRNDQLGTVFRHDIQASGVAFDTAAAEEGAATATSMILVTPDAQRTMNTYLGACGRLTEDDINADEIAGAGIVYVEGYLWDREEAKKAVLKAMKLAHENGALVSLTLSDSFCVDRFRAEFLDLVQNHVDILFANEAEILSLFQVDSFEEAEAALKPHVKVAAITRSEAGCVAMTPSERVAVPAYPADVEDTTGAGDLFAAGFLFGYATGRSLEDCGKLGCFAASEIISHVGARPDVNLGDAAQKAGLV